MEERPILFKGDMVRAILDGAKTQTRRVMNPQPPHHTFTRIHDDNLVKTSGGQYIKCPFGKIGDRLWLRENFYVLPELWAKDHDKQPIHYAADIDDIKQIEDYKCKPSIHMPRWASRISLEIIDIRVERVQDISKRDIWQEGVKDVPFPCQGVTCEEARDVLRGAFRKLWDSINEKRGFGWEMNPFCWVVEFEVVKGRR